LSKTKRFGIFPIEEILPHIEFEDTRPKVNGRPVSKKKVKLLGYNVNCHSIRLALFKERPLVCVHCGLKAEYFTLEKHHSNAPSRNTPHLNLYGKDADGNEVLFTKDHILPVSKGGKDILDNLQVLCIVCNMKKGNTSEVVDGPNDRSDLQSNDL
jgi:hypothetical protein